MTAYNTKSALIQSIVEDLQALIKEGELENKLIDIVDTVYAKVDSATTGDNTSSNLAWDSGTVYNTTTNQYAVYQERLYESKQDNNIGNEPPTTPNANGDFEDAWWKEVSANPTAPIPEYQNGTYTGSLVIVYNNGELYRLTANTPYESTNFSSELSAGDWVKISSTSPGGSTNQVQYNNGSGGFAANAQGQYHPNKTAWTFGHRTGTVGDDSHVNNGRSSVPNEASGIASYAEGYDNKATGAYSHVEGSENNANGFGSHVEGRGNAAQNDYSHSEGRLTQTNGDSAHAEGNSTQANGNESHAEGESTIADGNGSHAEGRNSHAKAAYTHAEGSDTIADGAYSHAEGYFTETVMSVSHAEGFRAKSYLYGQWARATGNFATKGDAQISKLTAFNTTTDGVAQELFLNGTAERLTLNDNTSWSFTIRINARRVDTVGEEADYELKGKIVRNAGAATTAIKGTPNKTVIHEDVGGWDVSLSADTSNGQLKINVTGESSKTIQWVARIELVENAG